MVNVTHLTNHGNEVQYSKLGTSYRNLSRGGSKAKKLVGVKPTRVGLTKAVSAMAHNVNKSHEIWTDQNRIGRVPPVDVKNRQTFMNMIKSPYQMPELEPQNNYFTANNNYMIQKTTTNSGAASYNSTAQNKMV